MPWFAEHGSPDVGFPEFPQEQEAPMATQPDQLPHQPHAVPDQTQSQKVEANSGLESSGLKKSCLRFT